MGFGQSMMSGLALLPLLLLSAISVQATTHYYKLPSNYASPSKYKITLEPDLEKFQFNGKAEITFTVNKNNTPELILNQKDLTITGVTLEKIKKDVSYKLTNQVPDDEREFVTLQFDNKLLIDDTYTLTINYNGTLNDKKRGFYRSRYLDANNNIQYIATTHFEPTGARMAFPCWDEPEYKAAFTITLIHPTKYKTVLSNMPISKTEKNGDKNTTIFKESPKMSSYLVAFVVSDYEANQNDDKSFGVFTKPNALNQTKYALEFGQKVIDELDKYTGFPYSTMMQKMDQISIKDFSAGAMENWGLVTYRETALLYEEGVSTNRNKQSVATVIAHEFAHQWFGDLVSPKWWKYIWLNEGFANYFQYYITDKVEPSWRLMELFAVEALQGTAFTTDAKKDTRPINHDVDSPAEISNLFDNIAYQKAGSVIRMMSYILTEPVFQKGLKNYLKTYKYSVAESDNLISTLQNAASADKTWAGQNLSSIMKEWLDKPGYPVVMVNMTNQGTLELSQERFLLNGDKDDSKWWIPISYVTNSTGNMNFNNITEPTHWMNQDGSVLTIDAKVANGSWVIVNPQQVGYYRVNYNQRNWELLTDYLLSTNYEKIHPVNRAQLIDDALALAREERLNYTVALTLSTYLHQEKDYIPWTTTFRNLNFFESVLYSSDRYPKFQSYVRHIMHSVANSVNYTVLPNENDVTKLLRTNVMKWACKVETPECLTAAQTEFGSWLQNGTKLDPDLKSNILCYGLKTANNETWNKAVEKLSKTSTDQDELNVELAVLGCSNDTKILQQFLEDSLTKKIKIDFEVAVQAIVTNNQLSGFNTVLNILEKNIEELKKYNNFEDRVKSCINSLGNVVVNQDQYIRLNKFSYTVGVKPDLIHSTLQKSMRNMRWIELHGEHVEKWFNEFNSAGTATLTSFIIILSFLVTRFY